MKIGLMSDTHGFLQLAGEVVKAMGVIDLLIHAGDHYFDAYKIAAAANIPVYAVVGNCDKGVDGPEEELLQLDEVRLYISHGHRHNVKKSISKLHRRAVELKANVAVFGHTHISGCWTFPADKSSQEADLVIINPGSLSNHRDGSVSSYGILEISGNTAKPKILYLE